MAVSKSPHFLQYEHTVKGKKQGCVGNTKVDYSTAWETLEGRI